jgi:hypothetical protein
MGIPRRHSRLAGADAAHLRSRSAAIAPDTMLHLWLTRGLLGLLSLGVVASFFAMGERISRQHAIIAGWVGAIWVEIFYFAARPSGDGIALTLTVPALCLAMRLRERPSMSLAGMLGLLLGLAFIVRFQYAPALALIGLLAVSGDARRTLLPLAGSLVAIALGALADMAAGAPPLLWLWRNFAINLGENRSASFGTQPAWWFVTQIGATWHIAMLVLLPSLVAGAPLSVRGAHRASRDASHSLIPHKEYRFVILAIALAAFPGGDRVRRPVEGTGGALAGSGAHQRHHRALRAVVPALRRRRRDQAVQRLLGNGRAANTLLAKAGALPASAAWRFSRSRTCRWPTILTSTALFPSCCWKAADRRHRRRPWHLLSTSSSRHAWPRPNCLLPIGRWNACNRTRRPRSRSSACSHGRALAPVPPATSTTTPCCEGWGIDGPVPRPVGDGLRRAGFVHITAR